MASVKGTLVWLLCFLILQFPRATQGQTVALVLSGGAAKGCAHIGVLKALEEHHIPVDFIVGTSIGALIGGLYAAGYSPSEIEEMLASEDFQQLISGTEDPVSHFYLKDDPNASWISTSFDFGKKLTTVLPTQFLNTYAIDFRLMKIFSGADGAAGMNFDSLMIPFRCIVADIDSSQEVVIRTGNLGSAIRGSMSIPLVFNPMEINGRLVVDGGVYNNFPADIANREFHPDVIIGSRVAQRYTKPDRDDLLSQLLVMLMERQSDTVGFPNSIMITPETGNLGLLDFSRVRALSDSGYKSAMRNMDKIQATISRRLPDSCLSEKRKGFKQRQPGLLIDSIYVKGVTRSQQDYISRVLKQRKKFVSPGEVQPYYFRIIGEGHVKMIYPEMRYNLQTGMYDLHLDITPTNRYSVLFGGNFSLANTSEAFLEVRYRYLWKNALQLSANGYIGRIYSAARISGRIGFNARVPWYLQLDYNYNSFNFFRSTNFFFDDKEPGYMISREYFGRVSGGIPSGRYSKLVLGGSFAITEQKYFQQNQFTRSDTADQTSFHFIAPSLTYELNSLNRKQYPNAGVRLFARISYVNGMESLIPGSTALLKETVDRPREWLMFRILYDNYFDTWGPVKFGFYGEAVISGMPLFQNYISTMLYAPKFQPLPESSTLFQPPYYAISYGATGLKLVVKVYKQLEYRLEGYIFQPYREIIQQSADHSASFGPPLSDRSFLASSALIYHSPVGPVGVTAGFYDKMMDQFSINFSLGYILFNERAVP